MKITKNVFAMFALAVLSTVYGFAQTTPNVADKPKFDAELAQKLGADKYGMRKYVFAVLKTSPNAPTFSKEDSDKIFAGHMANMNRLAEEGKLVVAGPFSDPKKLFRGLFILNVTTVEEAEKLINTDPVVKSGMMAAELVPWWGSAALMDTNRLHKLIAKENP